MFQENKFKVGPIPQPRGHTIGAPSLPTSLVVMSQIEIISGLAADAVITIYRVGPMVDLCSGPHLPSSGYLKVERETQWDEGGEAGGRSKSPLVALFDPPGGARCFLLISGGWRHRVQPRVLEGGRQAGEPPASVCHHLPRPQAAQGAHAPSGRGERSAQGGTGGRGMGLELPTLQATTTVRLLILLRPRSVTTACWGCSRSSFSFTLSLRVHVSSSH